MFTSTVYNISHHPCTGIWQTCLMISVLQTVQYLLHCAFLCIKKDFCNYGFLLVSSKEQKNIDFFNFLSHRHTAYGSNFPKTILFFANKIWPRSIWFSRSVRNCGLSESKISWQSEKISAKVSCFCVIIRMSPSDGLVIVCCNSIIP